MRGSGRSSPPACIKSTIRCLAPTATFTSPTAAPRGQEATVSIFRITGNGAREPFVHGLVNPTSMAVGPDGLLYVSTRFEGRVYRIFDDGQYEVMASDLGVACGLAFGADGSLYVGDRAGSVFRIDRTGRTEISPRIPSSIAAFHLAMSPDGDAVRLGADAGVVRFAVSDRSRRPRRNAEHSVRTSAGSRLRSFGVLHVVEALAGSSGVYAISPGREPELWSPAPAWSAWCLARAASMVVASNDSVYSFPPVNERRRSSALLALAAISLGLRTTSVLLGPTVHPLASAAALDCPRRADHAGDPRDRRQLRCLRARAGTLAFAVAGRRVRPREVVVQMAAPLTR